MEQLETLGARVVGISTDKVPAQRRFVERQGLTYPMLCDERGEVCRAYGVLGVLGLAKRVTFLVDAGGLIRKVYPTVRPATHAAEVVADLRAMPDRGGSV